ncbi:phosphotriesterase [Candidatus Latescibacterota bacterium]
MPLKNYSSAVTRRKFLRTGLSVTAGLAAGCGYSKTGDNIKTSISDKPYVNTVTGSLACEDMGFTLPHEHIIVDWNGGDGKSRERYDPDEVFNIMYPYLQEIKALGTQTFVDCTPSYLGRDVIVLKRLSIATGLNIITNTGFYERTRAPKFAFETSKEALADMFIKEALGNIEGTGIKPGFIKIGVSNEGPMIDFDRKLVTAACLAHKETGLTIYSHTFQGKSALEELDIIERENIDPECFVYVHACFEPDINYNIMAAERGVWIEFDSIRADTRDKHVERILTMLDRGFEDQLLISQDRGWYTVGEKNGGRINAYSYLQKEFLPFLEEKGVGKKLIRKLTVTNPARALAIKPL